MLKKDFKTGDIITPEFLNALQNLSFEKGEDEVEGLPLPPKYGEKVQVFRTEQGAVNLSSASSGFAIVEHYGSPTSFQPETITIDGIGGNGACTILLVTRGTDYPVTVSLPQTSSSRKEISIKGGSSVLLTEFSYGGALVWKYYELETSPNPSPHSINLPYSTSITLGSYDPNFSDIVSDIKVKKGLVDLTFDFMVDTSNQSFGGTFRVQLYNKSTNAEIETRDMSNHLNGMAPGSSSLVPMSIRFVTSVDNASNLSIKARFSSQGGSVAIKYVNVSGVWITNS